MRPISEATARLTGKSFDRKYVAIGRILHSWREIVGDKLAGKAQPVKINFRKREKDGPPVVILDIATTSADATLLHYQKDLILERINQIFGDRWITAIRFVASAANKPLMKPKKARKVLTDDEKSHLSHMLETCPDADLKVKLENLGQAIFMEDKK